jgi:hypothetical protein
MGVQPKPLFTLHTTSPKEMKDTRASIEALRVSMENALNALNTALSDDITALDEKTLGLVQGINNDISDINDAIATANGRIDSTNTALSNAISTLNTTINTKDTQVRAAFKAKDDELRTLITTEVARLDGLLSNLTNNLNSYKTANDTRVSNLEATVSSNWTDINAVLTSYKNTNNNRVTVLEELVASEVTRLEGVISSNQTNLQTQINTLSTTVTNNYNTLNTKINTVAAAIRSEFAAADTDLQNQIDALLELVTDNHTETENNFDSVNTAINALDTKYAGLTSSNLTKINTNISDISSLKSRASALESRATTIENTASSFRSLYDTFIARKDNPHAVTAAQVNAWSKTESDARFAMKVHSHDVLDLQDTRGNDLAPNAIARGITQHFKSNTTDGFSQGGTYHSILNIGQWATTAGGLIKQLGFGDNKRVGLRLSSSDHLSWQAWDYFFTTAHPPTYTDVGAASTTDARLSNSREWTASTVSQAEAEAGTATTRRAWTAQRVRQAIAAVTDGITLAALGGVPTTRTINSKALSTDITLSYSDVGAVPTSRTVNGKALSSNITLSAADVSARPSSWTPTAADVGAVPTSRTVNGKALSANISLSAADVGARADSWLPTVAEIGAVASSDSRLTNSREWTGETISQAEAEAGTATTRRAFTAQRVRQAILAVTNALTYSSVGAAAATHSHAWGDLTGLPAYATRWPTKAEVGLGNVPNVNTQVASNITSGVLAAERVPAAVNSASTGVGFGGFRYQVSGSKLYLYTT